MQKMIESLRTRDEISLVIDALRPGFLELIKDPNGNHVVQKCLQLFEADDNKVCMCVHMELLCRHLLRSLEIISTSVAYEFFHIKLDKTI